MRAAPAHIYAPAQTIALHTVHAQTAGVLGGRPEHDRPRSAWPSSKPRSVRSLISPYEADHSPGRSTSEGIGRPSIPEDSCRSSSRTDEERSCRCCCQVYRLRRLSCPTTCQTPHTRRLANYFQAFLPIARRPWHGDASRAAPRQVIFVPVNPALARTSAAKTPWVRAPSLRQRQVTFAAPDRRPGLAGYIAPGKAARPLGRPGQGRGAACKTTGLSTWTRPRTTSAAGRRIDDEGKAVPSLASLTGLRPTRADPR